MPSLPGPTEHWQNLPFCLATRKPPNKSLEGAVGDATLYDQATIKLELNNQKV